MTILEVVDFDNVPEIGEDETVRYMVTFKDHVYFATERAIYIILEEGEDYPVDCLY